MTLENATPTSASSSPASGGASSAPAASSSPSSGTSPGVSSPPPSGAAAGTPSSPGAQAPAGGSSVGSPAGSAAAGSTSQLRQLASQYAPQLAQQYTDDNALVSAALQQLAAQQQQMQYAQQMLPYYSQFQAWRSEQEARQRAAQQSGQQPWYSQWWNPPEYDPAWEHQLQRDAQGNIVPKPGAPPDLHLKYGQYQDYRRNQVEKLLQNPFTYIEQPVRQIAQQIAEQAVQRHLTGYQDSQFASNFVQQNTGWLHARDVQGQPVYEQVFDPYRGAMVARPQLSPLGQRFQQYVNKAVQLGVQDVRAQQDYAQGMLQRDIALAQQQAAAGAGAANDAARNGFLQQNGHQPNHAGSLSPPNLNGNAPAQNAGLDLGTLLRSRLTQGGVTDRDLQAVR